MDAIADHVASVDGVDVAVVISDRASAAGLEKARSRGVPTELVAWADHVDRATFTATVCDTVDRYGCDIVVLAGFMRILAPEAIHRFENRIINIHPSLLPSFPGAHAVADALAFGVKQTGVTVHLVDEMVDHGPILAQEPVVVETDDDESTLHARIQAVEHRLYPEVVVRYARDEFSKRDGEGR